MWIYSAYSAYLESTHTYTAAHCTTLQHIRGFTCNTLPQMCEFTLHIQHIWNPHKHTLQQVAAQCSILQRIREFTEKGRESERTREREREQYTGMHCRTALQHTTAIRSTPRITLHQAVTHSTSCCINCIKLQHAATRYQIHVDLLRIFSISGSISTYTAAHSSTQQHTTAHYTTLIYIRVKGALHHTNIHKYFGSIYIYARSE